MSAASDPERDALAGRAVDTLSMLASYVAVVELAGPTLELEQEIERLVADAGPALAAVAAQAARDSADLDPVDELTGARFAAATVAASKYIAATAAAALDAASQSAALAAADMDADERRN